MASDRGDKTRVKGKCPYCGAAVKGENLPRHLRSVHPGRQEALRLAKDLEVEARKSRPRTRGPSYGGGILASKAFLTLLIAVVVVVAGAAAAYVYISRNNGPDPEYTEDITQICYGLEQFAYHRHTILHITINNLSILIPAGIGISTTLPVTAGSTTYGLDSCAGYRPMHTHDTSGRIHMESRIPRVYPLGDFFKLWALNQPSRGVQFDATHLFGKDTSKGGSIQVIGIDGQQVSPANFLSTPLVNLNTSSDPEHIFITYTGP